MEILESGKCLIFIILDYGHMGQHFHENRENRDMHLFYFQFQFEHLSLLLDA